MDFPTEYLTPGGKAIRAIAKCIRGSQFTDANGDGDLSVYADDVEALAAEIWVIANGLECTCGIPQYGPGLEHNRECPRWEAS